MIQIGQGVQGALLVVAIALIFVLTMPAERNLTPPTLDEGVRAHDDVGAAAHGKAPALTYIPGNITAEILVLLAWRPRLLASQILQLRSIKWMGRIVLVCPEQVDVRVAEDVFTKNASLYGETEVFHFAVQQRLGLLSGHYFLLAVREYLNELKEHHKRTCGSAGASCLVVAVDTSRALWCHNIFNDLRNKPLTFIGSPLTPDSYYSRRTAFADAISSFPTRMIPVERPATMQAIASKRKSLVFSHLLGGRLDIMKALLDKILHNLLSVAPGLAIEPMMTDVVIPFVYKLNRTVAAIMKPSMVVSRRSECMGSGVVDIVAQSCSLGKETALVRNPASEKVVRKSSTVVIEFGSCSPRPHTTKSVPVNQPPEAVSPENCRRIFTNPSVVLINPPPAKRAKLLAVAERKNPKVVALWRSFVFKGSKAALPAPQAEAIDIVLGVAFGYNEKALTPFVSTFLKHHRAGQSKLVLIVKGPDNLNSLRSAFPSDDIVLIDGYPFFHGSPIAACKILLSRAGMLLNFLRTQKHPQLQSLRNVLVVDTRDAVFQADPFEALEGLLNASAAAHAGRADRTPAANMSSFLLIPMEKGFLSESNFFSSLPFRLNRLWIVKTFGTAFFGTLMTEPLTGNATTSDGVPFPILCGGLFLGSFAAIVDFFDLFVSSAMALGGCNVNDQGLLIGLGALGLATSSFPHRVFLTDPYTTPYANFPRGGGEVVFDGAGRVVDCTGAPYAVLHQYDRFPTLWAAMGHQHAVIPEG